MALEPRRLFIDVQNRTFLANPISTLPSVEPTWFQEDVEVVEVYAVRPVNNQENPYQFVDLTASQVKFAVGTVSPAALQTSFIPINTTLTASITSIQNGGSGLDEIQKITWTGAIASSGSYAIKFPERAISYTAVSSTFLSAANHGLYDGDIVTDANGISFEVFNAAPNSFSITNIGGNTAITASSATITAAAKITSPISYSASIEEVQQQLSDAGFVINQIPQIIVTGENCRELTFYYGGRSGGRNYDPIQIINSSLSGAPGVKANVSYNTTEINALIAAGTTNVTLEIEISEGAVRQTFQRSATLSNDLISSTSPSPLPANVASSFDLESPDGSVWTVTITDDGELKLAKQ